MVKALLLVDFQKEWIAENRDYCIGSVDKTASKAIRLMKRFHKLKLPVFIIQHFELTGDYFSKQNSFSELIPQIAENKKESDYLIEKGKISPFYNTNLEQKLKELNVDELVISGLLTNLCVRSSASDAYDRDYKITIVSDACQSNSKKIHKFTLEDLKHTRPEIELKKTSEVLKELK